MGASEEIVILVDENDREIGVASKSRAHIEGLRHRAISVLIVNSRGEMLLQKRQSDKYHSGGLWTNACCSHPRAGESASAAAARRLREEMGFGCDLTPMFVTAYRADVNGLIENEVVHVFGGIYDGEVAPDPAEVEAFTWTDFDALDASLRAEPERYTVWFRKYMDEFRIGVDALAAGSLKPKS